MTTYNELIGKRVESFENDPTKSITYVVTVASSDGGNKYFIDGVQQKQLRLYEGVTYNFDYSAASSHPFRFSTTSDGTHGGGSEYTTGVSVDSNITTIEVATGAPNLFYYCSSHSGMGGRANTPTQDSVAAQMWYNEGTLTFKSAPKTSAWASSASMTDGPSHGSYRFSGGIRDACYAAGGAPSTNKTEEYNGSGWSASNNMGTARYEGGSAGSLTAGLAFGGYTGTAPGSTATEEYDGSSWTAGGPLNQTGYGAGGLGTQSAALYASRFSGPSASSNVTEEYNGTSWTAVSPGTQNTEVMDVGTAGTQTAGLQFGGQPRPGTTVVGNTESYDGSTWTAVNAMNSARSQLGGSGIQTAAIAFGGRFTPPGSVLKAETEQYDGTSWSETADLGTARRQLSSTRVETGNSQALAFGGGTPSTTGATEEFTQSANVITAASWASGGNMVNSLYGRIGGGTQTAAISAGGEPPRTTDTEYYDGSSWSEQNNMNTARNQLGGAGSQTAFLVFGGENPGATNNTETESWNGSAWSEVNDMSLGRRNMCAFGTQTAAVAAGGFTPPGVSTYNSAVEEWNGSSWSANPNALPTNRAAGDALGTATAGLIFGGSQPPTLSTTFSFDGTSFAAGGNLVTAMTESHMTSGSQTDGLVAGGYAPSASTKTEGYDGTTWSTRPSMSQTRGGGSGLGSTSVSTASLAGGGYTGTGTTNATEEFTGETSALNVKTLTQS